MTQGKFRDISDEALIGYSAGTLSALDLRREFDATYADILAGLGRLDLPLPRAPIEGREQDIAQARKWLFGHGR